ncbi:MAG: hypothetical protein WC538_22845 [Thermoanaerobaculia bacterium]|jgi:hypothetical protein
MTQKTQMKQLLALAFSVVVALIAPSALAVGSDRIFTSYEEGRQALIKGSIPDIQKTAKQIAVAAAGQPLIKEKAATLGGAVDLKAARQAFAALSDEVIKYRKTRGGAKPVVAYCSMEKKSWLQPEGKIGNPYVGESMRSCGEITTK